MYSSEKMYSVQRSTSTLSDIEKLLLLTIFFSLSMVLFRIIYSGRYLFLFLVWNLFLAFVPYVISRYMRLRTGRIQGQWKFFICFLSWLVFIPNSFYLITDLVHLENRDEVPFWFDQALIFSFIWNGLLLGILSVQQMQNVLLAKWNLKNEWSFVYPVMLLNALGIYIGRYLRYNSWDVITNPFELAREILYLVIHPLRNRLDWGMILCYSIFLTLIYMSVKKIRKNEGSE